MSLAIGAQIIALGETEETEDTEDTEDTGSTRRRRDTENQLVLYSLHSLYKENSVSLRLRVDPVPSVFSVSFDPVPSVPSVTSLPLREIVLQRDRRVQPAQP